jgi:prepilin-type N-terminal cleavage/methylation domain-containing protein
MLKDMKMKQLTTNTSRGLTLTELLAVMMIISLLATIAVPVYVSRQEDARIRVAQGETREIAMAEEAVAAMHGFYVPFQLLDELPAHPDGDTAPDEERIDQHQFVGGAAGDANIYLIIPTIRAEDQVNNQLRLDQGRLTGGDTNPRVRKLIQDWSGPFITFHRFWYNPTGRTGSASYDSPYDPQYRLSEDLFLDFPLDPWGNPYRFYSPIGIIGDGDDERGNEFNFENPDDGFSNGRLVDMQGSDEGRRFQRYAVVSYGRDGLSDMDPLIPVNNNDNDIVYEFGTDGVSRNFGKF